MKIALAGNQNSGKTTLFNLLTGSRQRAGNFPGVTVEQKIGELSGDPDIQLVDLPGVYSLYPFSNEEIVTRDFLANSQPDGIINIVDATNIERNLYLTLQLLNLNIPTVIALNMMDEMRNNGGTVDTNKLSRCLGVPVIPISAVKNEGVNLLAETIIESAKNKRRPLQSAYSIPKNLRDEILDNNLDEDSDEALIDYRYNYIEKICSVSVQKGKKSKEQARSAAIDKILTHRFFGLPIFLCVMLLIFWISFGLIGEYFKDLLTVSILKFTQSIDTLMTFASVDPILRSLVIDGIIKGIGSILSFLPLIAALFFFLSILEDSGYMARVAFMMDSLLQKIGLSGRSFVPLLLGFGCSVPAVMSSRTLGSERERHLTICLIPFISCSAKLPVYSIFCTTFFPHHSSLVMLALYIIGILAGIGYAYIINKTALDTEDTVFFLELPPYRLPTLTNTRGLVWEKAKDFLTRAFTIIFLVSIIIWFLQTFDFRFRIGSGEQSMLAAVGKLLAPLFYPLGMTDWRIPTALIVGFTAKEAILSSLSVLLGTQDLSQIFTPLTAFVFLIFTLFYTPCIAAMSVVKRELGARKTAELIFFQTLLAYGAALVVFIIGKLLL